MDNDWYVADEAIVAEDGKIYEIITADALFDAHKLNKELYKERTLQAHFASEHREAGVVLTKQLLLLMGPRLVQQEGDVFLNKWHAEVDKLEKIYQSVASSHLPASRNKEQELSRLIKQLKEVLACLQKGKP
ncbi:hypothetical protein D3C77_600190 [compost metagenome]